jgi:SET domain-containing protein
MSSTNYEYPFGAEVINALQSEFYRKQSDLRRVKNDDGDSTIKVYREIGMGLFSMIPIRKNDRVSEFVGELIDFDETQRRDDAGDGGYSIQIKHDLVLDSFYFRDACVASHANSPNNVIDVIMGLKAKGNCKIRVDRSKHSVRLYATKNIPPHVELLWSYQTSYRFE